MTDIETILTELKARGSQKNIEGMTRFGIATENAYGVSLTDLRAYAKTIGTDHGLAERLWATGIREARFLACFIEDPQAVTAEQLERWVADFNSWDICDTCTGSLVDRTPFAREKIRAWTQREEEFVKRAGFALMAWHAVHDKHADAAVFSGFFPLIEAASDDERVYVKKAVSWALRSIGKRDPVLQKQALALAKIIKKRDTKAARWIANDAIKELESDATLARFARR